ncbi:CRISPR-associated protein Csm2 [Methanomicrobium sp. W14]|uniref:type III-A CRISPR-associated protein Csm2 n=1 Tax=Methanomicrobium sp. W14 TaxID=2817839 RepID=UPI001AEB30DB|nr:type III-A CRISPR-associated protein Csm2 [Methanomicrobium sp. W14]MBP2132414.1 CRISPR-associated protein Csm2 [Methanomicrobium sp. W14]
MSYERSRYKNEYEPKQNSRRGNSEFEDILKPLKEAPDLGSISIEDIAKPDGIAEKVAKQLKSNRSELNPTQLRKYFDSIIKIQEKISESGWESAKSGYYMLYPTLAYAKGRKTIPGDFYNFCTLCLDKIPSKTGDQASAENFKKFVSVMESLVAYSKYYEKE